MALLIPWLLNNKWLWWIGVAIAVIALYFGWQAHQRGIGAAKFREAAQKAAAKHEATTADQVRKADQSLDDPAQRDGVRRRHSRD